LDRVEQQSTLRCGHHHNAPSVPSAVATGNKYTGTAGFRFISALHRQRKRHWVWYGIGSEVG